MGRRRSRCGARSRKQTPGRGSSNDFRSALAASTPRDWASARITTRLPSPRGRFPEDGPQFADGFDLDGAFAPVQHIQVVKQIRADLEAGRAMQAGRPPFRAVEAGGVPQGHAEALGHTAAFEDQNLRRIACQLG